MDKAEKKTGAGFPAPKPRRLINRDGQQSRISELNAQAQAAGWKHLSEYLTAVRRGQAVIPTRPAVTPCAECGLVQNHAVFCSQLVWETPRRNDCEIDPETLPGRYADDMPSGLAKSHGG